MHPGSAPLVIAGREFSSRLLVGTGKFSSNEAMRDALDASGTALVTVALRRADLTGKKDPFANILDFIDPQRYLLLPNTSGAMNAAEAVRLARLARSAGLPNWVKLEIHPDPRYLLPDPVETFLAAQELVKDGFVVLPYINADPVLAKRLQDVGTATVMPLGSPIGSNRGIETRAQIAIIIEQATVPVVVDAGPGSAEPGGRGAGDGRGRRARQHGHCRGARSRADGAGVPAGGGSGARGVRGGAEGPFRHSQRDESLDRVLTKDR